MANYEQALKLSLRSTSEALRKYVYANWSLSEDIINTYLLAAELAFQRETQS